MRVFVFIFVMAVIPLTAGAGAISRQFGFGYGGVAWGSSLAELVSQRPGGDHFFSYGNGEREYSVLDEISLFGLSRTHMRAYYFFDETGDVVSASVTFPYEQREKLIGTLTLSFGPYQGMQTKGISTLYWWKSDDGTTLRVRATLDPMIGILDLGISGPNSMLLKTVLPDCTNPTASSKSKK